MKRDPIDEILEQWTEERPDLDTSSLGVVIRVMSLYRTFLRQATEALEGVNLELWEYDVLSALRRQGAPFSLPATRLARETGLSSGAMTNRIDRLESRRLVKRRQDKEDRRSINVSLTARGRKLIDFAIQHRLDAASESLKGIGASEQRALADLLRAVVLGTGESNRGLSRRGDRFLNH
jgi:DNA-binding MarR family transcriptional regulator